MSPVLRMGLNRIYELRVESKRSQTGLAGEIGVDGSTISRWETGITPIRDLHKQQLAELFGCSVAYLMGWDDNSGPKRTSPDGPVAA